MAQFNVQEAESNLSHLLEMVEHGEEVILARQGLPVAKLVLVRSVKDILGSGVGDPNYVGGHLTTQEACSPMSSEEADAWIEGRL